MGSDVTVDGGMHAHVPNQVETQSYILNEQQSHFRATSGRTSGIISNHCYICCSEMTAVHMYNVLQFIG